MSKKQDNKPKNLRINTNVIYIILGVSFLFNSIFLYLYFTEKSHFVLKSEDYPLLSKRIFTQSPNDIIINFVPLRGVIKDYVASQKDNISIYFEYLPSGTSFGVNDKQEYKLASLSKVPLVMSVLKKVEKNKLNLDDLIILKKEDLDPTFGNLWKKGEGTKISIRDLIEICLKESDNTAYKVLFRLLTAGEIIDVYNNLSIEVSSIETEPIVSPKTYMSIFRSLYLSSYLGEKDSNYILDILTQTIFKDRIQAGVPSSIKVAHKIGVFETADKKEEAFTDCGIVYHPGRPYALCIFVNSDEEGAKKHISYISEVIHLYMTRVRSGSGI